MIDDTNKPATTESAVPATTSTVAVSASSPAPKRVPKPRPVKSAAPVVAKPASRKTPAVVRAVTPAAKPVVHEPAPFVVKKGNDGKPAKAKKAKLVRDSFTMPEPEYAQIAALKKRCLDAGISAKKSEILRAAVASLTKLSDTSLLAAMRRLEVIKTGRPAKGSK